MAAFKTYRAWLELDIGLDPKKASLPLSKRRKLFMQRIQEGLEALETASPGISKRMEPFASSPFRYTAALTAEQIRAIWHIPELRYLSDRDDQPWMDVPPDKNGLRPFIVLVHEYHQQEGRKRTEVQELTLLIRSKDLRTAKADALRECRTQSAHVMLDDFTITKRWWVAKRAWLNTHREEKHHSIGKALLINAINSWTEPAQDVWRPSKPMKDITISSKRKRPKTWEWMLK
jgi:hypothetical protein